MVNSTFNRIPAPPADPEGWRGNALRFTKDPLTYMNRLRDEYGPVAALVQGGNEGIMFPGEDCPGTVFVFGPELNRAVLTQPDIFHSGPIIGPIYGTWSDDPRRSVLRRVGTGLFSLNGSDHQRHRRLIQPAFHKLKLDAYAGDMTRIAEQTVSEWLPGQVLDFQKQMFEHTLTVAGKTLFGQDFTRTAEHIGRTIQRWLELIPLVSIDSTQAEMDEFFDLCQRLDHEIRSIIEAKRHSDAQHDDVLSALIEVRDSDGDSLSEDELIGHINILLTAGHETTANVLSWTVFLLAQHPQTLVRLLLEIDAEAGSDRPTPEVIGQMPFLDRIIRESMRVFPPVTIGSRIAMRDVVLDSIEIPAGSEVVFSHYHTHHDAAVYDAPARFDPSRWETIQPSPYEYLPFSTGVKMCVGAPFAMMEIKLTLVTFLQRFVFQVVDDAVINQHVWVPLRPDHMPLWVFNRGDVFDVKRVPVQGSVLDMVQFD